MILTYRYKTEYPVFRSAVRTAAVLMLFLCFLLVRCPAASAASSAPAVVDPIAQKEGFSAVLYNNTNGLPTSEANTIAETSDGFIWIGSYSGLVRYDGNTFERISSTDTGISNVVSLFVDSRDRLWIGTNDNGLAMLDNDTLTIWSEEDGLDASKISSIAEDSNGVIYVGTPSGITVIDSTGEVTSMTDPRIDGVYVESLQADKEGRVYGITNNHDLFTLRDEKLVSYLSHTYSRVPDAVGILADPDESGKLYLGSDQSTLYHGSPERNYQDLEVYDVSPLFSIVSIKKIDGQLYLCGRNGIGVLNDEGFHYLDMLPMNNSVGSVMNDYEGNLWFTSSRQGVMKVVSNRFQNLYDKYSLPPDVVNGTCMLDGKLFIGSDTGLVVFDGEKIVTKIPLKKAETISGVELGADDLLELLVGCRIRSIIRDSHDRLWISTWGSHGLLRYDHGEVRAFTENDGLISNHVRTVCEQSDGSILVALSGGVCVIKGDRVTDRYSKRAGVANDESLTVSYNDNGDILLGSNGSGIYVINEEGIRCIGKEDGLSSGIILRIKRDEERRLFWIVTSNSISYMTFDDYKITTIKSFPYSNNFDLYENSNEEMWVLSSNGIYVLPTEDLLNDDVSDPVHYTLANGLPCTSTSNSYCELTENGDLYLAGSTGVARVNIEEPLEDVTNMKAAVPFVDVDGDRYYPDKEGVFRIPASTRKLTLYAYVFNYSLNDPQITYHLEGFDDRPVTINRSDLVPIDYTNLPGGTYHFIFELKDYMDLEDKSLVIPIIKTKKIYEESWFYIVVAFSTILLIAEFLKLYLERKTRIFEKKQQEAVEKERLNTELQTAGRIQGSMLPQEFPPFPDRKEFEIYASMDPAREVGGDFYDFFLIDKDHLCLVIADVSGKGIPASLFMMASKVILQSCAMLGKSTAEILNKTNEALCSNNQVEMFVTIWLGILEISTGKIIAANAGHEYPALMKDGKFALLKDKHGFVIGGMDGVRYKEYEIDLKPGDKLFVYTDGVPEATDSSNNMFGTERMITALNQDPGASPEKLLHNVRSAVDGFVKEAEQFDDLTMLCIEYKGPDGGEK